jgi:hypothetical protein
MIGLEMLIPFKKLELLYSLLFGYGLAPDYGLFIELKFSSVIKLEPLFYWK